MTNKLPLINEQLFVKAEKAIETLFSDMTVDRNSCRGNMISLREFIDELLYTLDACDEAQAMEDDAP